MMDAADRVFHCASFLGFADNDNEQFWQDVLSKFMSDHFPSIRYLCVGSMMKGPHNDRKLTKKSFIQFFDQDTRNKFLKTINDRNLKILNSTGATLRQIACD